MPVDYKNIFKKAYDAFREETGHAFSDRDIVIRGFASDNAKQIIDSFKAEYGFCGGDVTEEHIKTVVAETFVYGNSVDRDVSGILIREDMDASEHNVLHILLHELSHIFITLNEIEGGHFYDCFCASNPKTETERIEDGYMNAGYAIWRELAAEIMATSIDPRPGYYLSDESDAIQEAVHSLQSGECDAKTVMHNLLVDVVFSSEFAEKTWQEIEPLLRKEGIPFPKTIEMIYYQLEQKRFYYITPEFIYKLGTMYLTELSVLYCQSQRI